MLNNYDSSLKRILVHEGGYSNHPADPGGPTNFGITLADYRKYIKPSGTAADVRTMAVADAAKIYRTRYWDSQQCSALPPGLDYAMFDYGVNSGIGRSGKVLRRLIGMSDSTSIVNREVVEAVLKRDTKRLIGAVCDERLAFLKRLKTWPTFGVGWGRRVAEVRTLALRMMDQDQSSNVIELRPTPPAGANEAAKGMVPEPEVLKAGAGGGLVVIGAGAALTWSGWVSEHEILAALIGVGVLFSASGLVYLVARRHQSQQEASTPGTTVVPEKLAA